MALHFIPVKTNLTFSQLIAKINDYSKSQSQSQYRQLLFHIINFNSKELTQQQLDCINSLKEIANSYQSYTRMSTELLQTLYQELMIPISDFEENTKPTPQSTKIVR